MIRVPVALADASYEVAVGPGARHLLAGLLPAGARRAAIVTQAGIGVEVEPGIEHKTFTIGAGEAAKALPTVGELCGSFATWGLTRADVVIAVGGGVVTDTAGLAAALYHRGTAVVHVATTLLAQVDAAIGGKTGVNITQGKNLVGAFWQPHAVVCDIETLSTLPASEWRSGQGEMAKYAFLGVEDLVALSLEEQVAACVAAKAAVVSADEREGPNGQRVRLNYGHTLAHALETAGGYQLRHGEAVAIGLVFAAELSARLGRIDAGRVRHHRQVVAHYKLPQTLPGGVNHQHLIELMGRDKKALNGLSFVLDGPEGVELITGVEIDTVAETLEAVS